MTTAVAEEKLTPTSQFKNLLDPVLKHATSTLRWLSAEEAKGFMEWIRALMEGEEKILRMAPDHVSLMRAQGAMLILDQIINLRSRILEHQQRNRA